MWHLNFNHSSTCPKRRNRSSPAHSGRRKITTIPTLVDIEAGRISGPAYEELNVDNSPATPPAAHVPGICRSRKTNGNAAAPRPPLRRESSRRSGKDARIPRGRFPPLTAPLLPCRIGRTIVASVGLAYLSSTTTTPPIPLLRFPADKPTMPRDRPMRRRAQPQVLPQLRLRDARVHVLHVRVARRVQRPRVDGRPAERRPAGGCYYCAYSALRALHGLAQRRAHAAHPPLADDTGREPRRAADEGREGPGERGMRLGKFRARLPGVTGHLVIHRVQRHGIQQSGIIWYKRDFTNKALEERQVKYNTEREGLEVFRVGDGPTHYLEM
ncbi:hypothetical protein C8R44DRAFT_918009 [Mycena epipterygia]|nr:hypothetical protein C8R44DRAFT_918009 [Mycena epipterygia]